MLANCSINNQIYVELAFYYISLLGRCRHSINYYSNQNQVSLHTNITKQINCDIVVLTPSYSLVQANPVSVVLKSCFLGPCGEC